MKRKPFLLAAVLLVSAGLFGCGNKEENGNTATTATSKDYVYRATELGLKDDDEQSINQIFRAGDAIYAYGSRWTDEGECIYTFYEINEDGTIGGSHELRSGLNTNINRILMDEDANLYCVKNVYYSPSYAEDPADTEENAGINVLDAAEPDAEDTEEDETLPEARSEAGADQEAETEGDAETISEESSEENDDASEEETVDDYYLVKMNLDGEELFSVKLNDVPQFQALAEENGMSLALADLEAGTLGERYTLPGRSYDYSYYPGVGYDLYLASSYGVYGYNLGDEDKTPIMSFVDSDFSYYSVYQVTGLNEREFLAITSDWDTGDTLTRFTKVDPEDVKDKKVITLAMTSTDWGIRRLAIQFNKSNEEYRISVLDYEALYGTDDDWQAGVTRLNTDIVSGKVPDILLLNYSMPVDSYISKGLFADLKPFIEKDEALSIEDFMPNVIEACSVDGKLYSLVPSYSIDTLVAKTSDVGKERGWTVQDVKDVLASKPEGTQLLMNVDRDTMLQYCFTLAGSQFIDWESGSCNFNSDGFIQMLEFIATFPEEVNWEAMPDNFWDTYDSMWREGKVIANFASIGDLRNFNSLEKGTFGEEITMIGFPSSDGDGSAIWPNLQFALSAKSKNSEGAWEFLRTFLTDDYQKSLEYGFPLSVKHLDQKVEEAMKKPFYMDENNNKVEYDETSYVNGVEVVISPITKERADEIIAELYSFTQLYRADDTLLNIVREEAGPFFAGQKNAKEVASIIQSRVQIYVNENR